MKKSPIHQTPEERLATNSSQSLSALDKTTKSIEQTTKAVEGLRSSIKDKSVEMDGFTGMIKNGQKSNTKLEEIKSASLITNKHLKDIKEGVSYENEVGKAIWSMLKGPKGDRGEKGNSVVGPQGPVGQQGSQGRIGEMGPQGPVGRDGKDGESIVGPQGMAGKDGRDGIEGKDADEKEIIKKVVKEVLKRIPDITQDTMNQVGITYGAIGDPSLKFFVKDLSGELNGVLKTFTITQNRIILDIASSSFPWTFRPTVDYTISGESRETLTFTNEIDAASTLAVGQTLIVTGIRP